MVKVNIELTFNQLVAAIRRLPHDQKVALWRLLDAELKSDEEVLREFDAALEAIRTANRGVTEDEVMADVEQALKLLSISCKDSASLCLGSPLNL